MSSRSRLISPLRRKLLACAATAPFFPSLRAEARTLLIGTTPVFLDDQATFLDAWRRYIEQRMGVPVRFVQRREYREVVELLLRGGLDFAWICGYPFVKNKQWLNLVATPVYRGQPLYQSYLIVARNDRMTRDIRNLRGTVHAFSDPNSNSGWLVPHVQMIRLGLEANGFFRKSFFTWAHRKSVESVAVGLSHGASVDGYVWDTLQRTHPDMTSTTRVAQKSDSYGFPPIVAARHVSAETSQAMQNLLREMAHNPQGRALLARLNLDGFTHGDPALYTGIERNIALLDTAHASA